MIMEEAEKPPNLPSTRWKMRKARIIQSETESLRTKGAGDLSPGVQRA